nr:DUF5337 domain-containing protein [Rubellimicrobium arenae]
MADPRKVVAPRVVDPRIAAAGRRASLVLVVVGLFWIASTWVGGRLGWSARVQGLFDLFALAGFGFALYLTWQVWRLRRTHKG